MLSQMKSRVFAAFVGLGMELFGAIWASGVPDSALSRPYHLGSWIWATNTKDWQECRFWRAFDIPATASVKKAVLRITADNSYRLFVDGQDVGHGSDWHGLTCYDLTPILKPGNHILAVEGYNDFDYAGVILGLQVELTDGGMIEIGSDQKWRLAPTNESNWQVQRSAPASWPPATVIAGFRQARWWGGTNAVFKVYNAPVAQPLPAVPFWRAGWFQSALALLCAGALIACLYLVSRLVMQSHAQQVVQRERARIARDIHDDLGGKLTQLVLLVETAQQEVPPNSPIYQRNDEICEHTREILRALNDTVWIVNSQRDTLPDFASYLCKYAETFFHGTPIRCWFDIDSDMPSDPCDVGIRRNLFLAVKEALNNALKHSRATEVFLRVTYKNRQIAVEIEDNGRGLDPSAVSDGNGLRNMRDRAAEAGGECVITSPNHVGCRVRFTVPMPAPRGYRAGNLEGIAG